MSSVPGICDEWPRKTQQFSFCQNSTAIEEKGLLFNREVVPFGRGNVI